MKPNLIIIVLSVLSVTACKKEKQSEKMPTLLGKWNFRAGYLIRSDLNRSDTLTAVYADSNNISIVEYTVSVVSYYTKLQNSEGTTTSFKYKIVGNKEVDEMALEWIITYDNKTLKRVSSLTNQQGYSQVEFYDRIEN